MSMARRAAVPSLAATTAPIRQDNGFPLAAEGKQYPAGNDDDFIDSRYEVKLSKQHLGGLQGSSRQHLVVSNSGFAINKA